MDGKIHPQPVAEKIVWHQSDRVHDRFYWLALPDGVAKPGLTIQAGVERNIITLGAPDVRLLRCRLVPGSDRRRLRIAEMVMPPHIADRLRDRRLDRRCLPGEHRGEPFVADIGQRHRHARNPQFSALMPANRTTAKPDSGAVLRQGKPCLHFA